MSQPKIAYVLFIFPVLSETTVVNELLALERLGASVRVLSWESPEGHEFYTITNVQHQATSALVSRTSYMQEMRRAWPAAFAASARLIARNGLRNYWQAYQLARTYRMIGNLRGFMRVVAPWADDLSRDGTGHIHAHFATEATGIAHVLSVLSHIPFSFTAHAIDIYHSDYQTPEKLCKKMHAAQFVVTVCHANKRYMLENCPDMPAGRVRVKRPGVDLEVFRPGPARNDHARFRIVSIGRLVATKGYADLVKACVLLQQRGLDFECTIVGEGPCRPDIEAAIGRHNLNGRVRLAGALPREQIAPLLDASDLFALPCFVDPETGDRDGMPLVLAEAMAKKLPVIATPVSGIPELVRDGAGRLVPQRDVAALASAIADMMTMDSSECVEMGRRGRAIVEAEFDELRESARLLGWFNHGSD